MGTDSDSDSGGEAKINWKVRAPERPKGLTYAITEKPPFGMVVFTGMINKETLPVLEDCEKDVLHRKDELWVLVFSGITAIDMSAAGPLTRLQKVLREKGALRLCALRPELKKYLINKTALREAEYVETPAEAFESLKSALK